MGTKTSQCTEGFRLSSQDHSIQIFADVSDHINRVVTAPSGVQTDPSKVVHSSYRPICHLSEPQGSAVHIPSSRPTSMDNRCSKH